VVPLRPGTKKPYIRWKQYQRRLPTEAEVRDWFRKWPDAGVGLVLGPVSDLLAIDSDGPDGAAALVGRLGIEPVAPRVLSGSHKPGHFHLLFRHPGVSTRAKATPWHPKLEFRGRGGLLAAPPTRHASGQPYAWDEGRSLDDLALADPPPAVVAALAGGAGRAARPRGTAPAATAPGVGLDQRLRRAAAYLDKMGPAVEGSGGDRQTYRAARALVHKFGLIPEEAMPLLRQWNETHCQPPWPEEQLAHKLQRAAGDPRSSANSPDAARPAPISAGDLDHVRDLGLIDPSRAQLIEAVGDNRSLFDRVGGWPDWEEEVARAVPTQPGESRVAAAARAVAGGPGGVIWTDPHGVPWAVRLLPDGSASDAYLALAFSETTATLPERGPYKRPVLVQTKDPGVDSRQDLPAARSRLAARARSLRLYGPAETLLWWLHAAFLERRSSGIPVPDVDLATALWGPRRRWPKNWRQEVWGVLTSLTALRWARVSTADGTFHPRLRQADGADVLYAVRDDRRAGKGQYVCRPGCPLYASGRPHGHFAVRLGPGFWGELGRFKAGEDQGGVWRFDFRPDPGQQVASYRKQVEDRKGLTEAERRDCLRSLEKQVREGITAKFKGLVSAPLLALACGGPAGLTAPHRRVLRCLTREVTRRGQQSGRPDNAHVFAGDRLPAGGKNRRAACPQLDAAGRHVVCGGNGGQWGRGYRLTTWASRAGFGPAEGGSWPRAVAAFLGAVASLPGPFRPLAVGFLKGEQFDLDQLLALARSRSPEDRRRMTRVQVRFVWPEDYLDRWRSRVVEAGGAGEAAATPGGAAALRAALQRAGITQAELARRLGKGRSFVTKLLSGRKRFPPGLEARAWEAVTGAGVTQVPIPALK
jgi:hypothetical protein